MKVHVDEERCEGHGRCYALAPDGVRARRHRQRQGHRRRHRRRRRRGAARLAVANCPEQAITIDEDDLRWATDDHPVVRLGHRLRPHRRRLRRRPVPDLGRAPRAACPVAHTDRYGGAWLPTRHDDVSAIAYDTEHFTSRSIVMSEFRPPLEIAPAGIAPPDLVGPALPQGRPAAAAAGVRAAGHRQARGRRPATTARS